MQPDSLETWRFRFGVDPGSIAVNPIGDRAVSIVVVGIHTRIAFLFVTVPAFPHGCRAMVYEVSPGRKLGCQQETISNIAVPGIGERSQQIWCSEKASAQ